MEAGEVEVAYDCGGLGLDEVIRFQKPPAFLPSAAPDPLFALAIAPHPTPSAPAPPSTTTPGEPLSPRPPERRLCTPSLRIRSRALVDRVARLSLKVTRAVVDCYVTCGIDLGSH